MKKNNIITLFISMGVGIGISTLLFFIWLVITGSAANFNYFETVFLILMAACCLRIKKPDTESITHNNTIDKSPLEKIVFPVLSVIFVVITLISLASAALYYSANPYGDNELDSLNFWTGKAAFFYRADNHHWSDILNSGDHLLNHPDYPLLLPDAVAKTWVYLGQESQLASIAVSFVFVVITTGLLFSFLKYLKNTNYALIAGIILLSTPSFLKIGFNQIADVPFGFFMLCSICLIIMERKTQDSGLLYVLGMSTGLCAWTKNEGVLFTVLVVVFRFLALLPFDGIKKVKNDFLKFFLGALPVMAVLIYFKLNYACANDIFAGQKGFDDLISRVFDYSRYAFTAQNFIVQISDKLFGYPLFLLLAVYAFFTGIKTGKDSGIIIAAAIFAGMLIGYFVIYIITPYNLEVFLRNSLYRLLVQLLPSFLLIYFSLLKPLKQETP